MIKKHEIKSIFVLTLPLMMAFFAQKCMQLIDTVMLGWISPEALAAGALATSIFFTTIVFCMGILSSVGICIARAKGANDTNDMRLAVTHGIFLSLFLSIPCILIVWYAPCLLVFTAHSPAIIGNVKLLLHGLVYGIPGFLLFLTMREIISVFSLTSVVMIVT